MRLPLPLSLALSRIATSTRANGSLLLVIGLAVILALSVFTMLPQSSVVLLSHQPQSAFATFPGENGKIVFISVRDGNTEIYVMNPDGNEQTQLTNVQDTNYMADWSPDCKKIAFNSDKDPRGNFNIYSYGRYANLE